MPINKIISEKKIILAELRKRGCRITNQRNLLIDIILDQECSCCKEIYYQAVRKDPTIGLATVYRMVKTLEEIGAINRKNMYRICLGDSQECWEECTVVLNNSKIIKIDSRKLNEAIQTGLKAAGVLREGEQIDSIRM